MIPLSVSTNSVTAQNQSNDPTIANYIFDLQHQPQYDSFKPKISLNGWVSGAVRIALPQAIPPYELDDFQWCSHSATLREHPLLVFLIIRELYWPQADIPSKKAPLSGALKTIIKQD
jgi:hypothetical protein